MTSADTRDETAPPLTQQIADYIDQHPNATMPNVLGHFGLPASYIDTIGAIMDGDDPETVPDPDGDGDAHTATETPQDDDGPTVDADTIREHYRRSWPVYGVLNDVEGNPTVAKAGDKIVYTYRPNTDVETADDWPRIGRPMTFKTDYDELVDAAARGVGDNTRRRTLYAHTSYNDPKHLQGWYRRRDADSKADEWDIDDINPMPGKDVTRGISAWGDIDLADDVGDRRPDLTDDEIETVERAIEAYVDEFAALYGSRDAVYALDSVGGIYVMGAPEATLPAVSALRDDPDGTVMFVDEFFDRTNDYLKAAEERVNERVDGAADMIDPDWLNNVNRCYKPPMSIHAKHDAVVTPIDTDDVRYEYTPIGDALDDDLIVESLDWALAYTANDHAARIDDLIETLWPDEYAEADGWLAAIRLWIENEREAAEKDEQTREKATERERERIEGNIIPDGDRTLTTSIEDVYKAVGRVDITKLVRRYCATWEPTGREHHFDPGRRLWKDSDSGESCFVNPSENTFTDTGHNGGTGGPDKFMAIVENIIPDPSYDLSGREYVRAVDALRDEGHDIPEHIPEAGSGDGNGGTYEETPHWALKRAAVATGVIPPTAFVTRENDDGDTYEDFPGASTYNRTLAELEDRGIDHGRHYWVTDQGENESYEEAQARTRKRAMARLSPEDVERKIDAAFDDETDADLARMFASLRGGT